MTCTELYNYKCFNLIPINYTHDFKSLLLFDNTLFAQTYINYSYPIQIISKQTDLTNI